MPASSFFGSLGELARHRTAKISVKQEKQDRLTDQMRKMQIAGVKAQQDKYDKQKTYYDQMDNFIGEGKDPWGGYRLGLEGTTSLTLKDYGIDYDLGPLSTKVDMILSIEGTRK